jgi:hypothetical protein
MSTATGLDIRGTLIGWANGLASMYSADVNGIPEEDWNKTFGGCTRPASALSADAIGLIFWITGALGGTPPEGYGGSEALDEAVKTRQGTVEVLKKATDAFCQALGSASDEKLNTPVMAPWGMEAPLLMLCTIAVSHVWYHDGQLNYIHCLRGDDKIYWMAG